MPSVSFSTSFTRQANGDIMKMYLDEDEWYPVLTLRKERYAWMTDSEVEVDANIMEEYDRIMDEFDALQTVLNKLPITKIKPTEKF
jgi:hypothetical protein